MLMMNVNNKLSNQNVSIHVTIWRWTIIAFKDCFSYIYYHLALNYHLFSAIFIAIWPTLYRLPIHTDIARYKTKWPWTVKKNHYCQAKVHVYYFKLLGWPSSFSSNIVQAYKDYHVQTQCNTLNDLVGINIVMCRCLYLQCSLLKT